MRRRPDTGAGDPHDGPQGQTGAGQGAKATGILDPITSTREISMLVMKPEGKTKSP